MCEGEACEPAVPSAIDDDGDEDDDDGGDDEGDDDDDDEHDDDEDDDDDDDDETTARTVVPHRRLDTLASRGCQPDVRRHFGSARRPARGEASPTPSPRRSHAQRRTTQAPRGSTNTQAPRGSDRSRDASRRLCPFRGPQGIDGAQKVEDPVQGELDG